MEDQNMELTTQTMMTDDEEVEIDLLDLFAYLLRRWKSILVVGLIGAFLVSGVKYAMDLADAVTDYSDEAYDELAKELTSQEISNVQKLYSQYVSYLQQIEYYENHYDYNSLWDPNNVMTCMVELAYTSDHIGTVTSFSRQALGTEEYKEIAEIWGFSENYQSVSSLITISGTEENDSYSVDLEGGESVLSQSGGVTAVYSGKLYFEVIGTDQEQCDQVAQVVRDAIEAHAEELREAGISIELTEVSTNYKETLGSTTLSNLQSATTNMADITEELADFEEDYIDELDDEETALFEFLVGRDAESEEEREVRLSKTMIVVGLIVGVFLMAVVYAALYLLGGTVKCIDEVIRLTGRPVYGVLHKDQYKGLNGLFDRWADGISYGGQSYRQEAQRRLIEERILEYAQRTGAKEFFLVTENPGEKTSSFLAELEEKEAGESLSLAQGDPTADGEAFVALRNSAAAVVVVELQKTDYKAVEKNVDLCRELGIGIAGSVAVGEM